MLLRWILSALLLTGATHVSANAFENAPPAFGHRDHQAVPIDISRVDIDLHFDYARYKAYATATVVFTASAEGYPFLDLVPNPTSLTLNGVAVPTSDFVTTSDPHGVTQMRVLRKLVTAGDTHVLEIDYELRDNDVSFSSGNIRAGFFMSDLTTGGRDFFEQYGPANYEYDQIQYNMNVRLSGVSRDHVVYTNAEVEVMGDNHWQLTFPDYFTTSMPYFHLTEAGRFVERRDVYNGTEKDIPILVYSSSSSNANSGMSRGLNVMEELENTYGPYRHDKVVIYVTSGGGGMEYGGATMTSLGALGHELTHFWFARGVMPSKGNSGWIDEAIASWRDRGYQRASGPPNRSAVNLGGFSPYRRHTTRDAYSLGRNLIEEFDYMFRQQGGMKTILKEMFAQKQGQTISISWFQDFLETQTGQDLQAIFDRYVFGQQNAGLDTVTMPDFSPTPVSTHPLPYTREEIELYR